MTKYSAIEIAHWFLAWANHNDASISNLKLQKLLYYAQGHYLAKTQNPLFNEDIQAWAHGPVVKEVYHRYKNYDNNPIDPDAVLSDNFNWDDFRDVEDHLMKVWNTYGHYDAWYLRNRTHKEEPWKNSFQSGKKNIIISNESIRDFFSKNEKNK